MTTTKYLLHLILLLLLNNTAWSKRDDAWINSQIASDPRIQLLRQFAEIHQLKFNTQPEESFHFVNTTDSVLEQKYIYYIIQGNMYEKCPVVTWFKFLLYLKKPFYILERGFFWKETDIVFNIWNPFQTGIVGFGVGKNLNFDLIYRNRTSEIDTRNQDIMAYIQEDFLQSIAEHEPETQSDGFIAFIFFSKTENNTSFNGVGFRIPQYCNRNGIPPLKVYFDTLPASNWMSFGLFQIPNKNTTYSTCLIERMSYISLNISTNHYYRSYESVRYCPPATFEMGPDRIEFEIATMDSLTDIVHQPRLKWDRIE
ncbi:hypothetical protein QE152_g25116 [Popillia japonica]|uniref:Uncharacterized protein n=1 Tax=Popillia japonica TaxID=7064 RepID=A0AAW1K2M0_POPJA